VNQGATSVTIKGVGANVVEDLMIPAVEFRFSASKPLLHEWE
jgi:hypothetical protein